MRADRNTGTSVQFEIQHHVTCEPADEALLAEQMLRLRPRTDGRQWLDSFELSIDPKPESLNHVIDAEGNVVTIVRPAHDVRHFEISVRSRVQIHPATLVESSSGARQSLPYSYPENLKWLLAPARHRSIRRSDDDPVHDFAERLRRISDNAPGFLDRLATMLSDQFDHVPEENGLTQSVAETLDSRRGTGSDLSALFIEATRAMGFATRFVSGYHAGGSNQLEAGLHAWAEVFLPNSGWVGFDPTLGQPIGERHIALAAAADPKNAATCGYNPERNAEIIIRSTVSVLELAAVKPPLVSAKRRRA